jgi:hypothetical protein
LKQSTLEVEDKLMYPMLLRSYQVTSLLIWAINQGNIADADASTNRVCLSKSGGSFHCACLGNQNISLICDQS